MTVGFSVHDLKLQGGAIATELCFFDLGMEGRRSHDQTPVPSPPLPGNAENVDLKFFELNRN